MRHEKKGSSLFYKVLLALLLALFLIFCYIRFGLLRPWLTNFEAAQPKHTSQQVFQELFSPADWGRVYDEAKLDGTAYQGRDGFIQSMEELTAGQELTLVETSAGLSGDRRYIVKSGSSSIAAFTLANAGQNGETLWQLDSVEMLLGQTGTVTVRTGTDCRVLVNGTELDEDCQIQRIEQVAERYLPQGIHGPQTVVWQSQASSIQQAEVTVLDGTGASLPLTYDAESNCFSVQTAEEQPSEEERAMLLGAAKIYAKYMIRQATAAQVQSYFDSQSQIYQTIRSSEIWIKNTAGHSFENENIQEYYRYSPDVFSARVIMDMNVRRGNGTTKPYAIDSTFFFHRTNSGWRAFEMTNVNVKAEILHSRLVFMNDQTEVGRLFVSSEDRSFTPPTVTPPQGQHFAGWATREQSGDSVTMTVRFQPGEDGSVRLPENHALEPMTLYAAFEPDN